jgi:hypothetical protein
MTSSDAENPSPLEAADEAETRMPGPGARPEVQRALDDLKELLRDVHDIDSTLIIRAMRDEKTELDASRG